MNRRNARVEVGAVASVVRAARLSTLFRAGDDHSSDGQHILRFPSGGFRKLLRKQNFRPIVDITFRFGEPRFVAHDADEPPHRAFQRVAHVGDVDRGARPGRRRRVFERQRAVLVRRLERDFPGQAPGRFAVSQRFEQTVRRQSVRAVQTDARDFPGGPKPLQRRSPVAVGQDAPHRVVGARSHRNSVFSNVDAELGADRRDPRETSANPVGVLARQIEKNVRRVRFRHLTDDRAADDVARREFAPFVVIGHKAVAVFVDEPSAFAAHRFGDETAAPPGDVKNGRVKLDEFKVATDRSGAKRHRDAVAARDVRIRRFSVNLSETAGCQDCLFRPN